MTLDIPVILGTVREGRHSEHVARYVHGRLSERSGVQSAFVDPRDIPLGNLVARVWEMDAPPALLAYVQAMERADAFVIVTPEYNHGIPGALKNLLDVTYKEWNRKPFGLVGCGGISGGLRAIEMLRQVVSGLGAVSVPAHLPVPFVKKTFDAAGPIEGREDWDRRTDKFLDEVQWYAKALQDARTLHPPAKS